MSVRVELRVARIIAAAAEVERAMVDRRVFHRKDSELVELRQAFKDALTEGALDLHGDGFILHITSTEITTQKETPG